MTEAEMMDIVTRLDISEQMLNIIGPNNRNEAISKIAKMYMNGEVTSQADVLSKFTINPIDEQSMHPLTSAGTGSQFAGVTGGTVGQLTNSSEQIKFDPAKLMEASEKLKGQYRRYVQCVASIKKKSEKLLGSWQSDSSTLYLDKVNEIELQSNETATTLSALADDLAAASGIYKTGEADAKKKTEALPTDGVFLV